jgi:asparagine synthase (glutamine-hydrolysing)
MCGIAGIVGREDEALVRRMIATLAHRGPDRQDVLVQAGTSFGHARLSVIDTSDAAHQPMVSEDGKLTIVFNGEIYNFNELRDELKGDGYAFRTASDTEVILALYAKEGEACFARLAGMFAIALYDSVNKILILARDRMGEKPLYWEAWGGIVRFASELKALMGDSTQDRKLDPSALVQYLQFDYVPTPGSILAGVHKLEPATYAVFKDGALLTKEMFWKAPALRAGIDEPAALNGLDAILRKTVARELVADVPLGVFLSGGLDSSTIAYYAQKASAQPLHTFSIGFDEPEFDESRYAREVAAHLGTVHHEHIVRAEDALALVKELPDILCEPMADASIIPTLLLSRFARESVTVALGGDGGDELFAGYPTFQAEAASKLYAAFPEILQKGIARAVASLPASTANFSFTYGLKKLISSTDSNPVHRHLEWLGSFGPTARELLAGPLLKEAVASTDVFIPIDHTIESFTQADSNNRLLFAYARSYLMDQVLVKVDRASMRYGLETRAPFLDHGVVEYMFSLPYSYKYRNGTTKYLLKKLMEGKLPSSIIYRKKKGFGIPLARWLRGPLKEFCLETLATEKLYEQGYFDPGYVQHLISEHMEGHTDNRKELWNLIIFQLWHDRWMR